MELCPAHAGMTRVARMELLRVAPLPRTRGDVTGNRHQTDAKIVLDPAHAGMAQRFSKPQRLQTTSPRPGGDETQEGQGSRQIHQHAPFRRGWHDCVASFKTPPRPGGDGTCFRLKPILCPAPAGMTRVPHNRAQHRQPSPRSGGDDTSPRGTARYCPAPAGMTRIRCRTLCRPRSGGDDTEARYGVPSRNDFAPPRRG